VLKPRRAIVVGGSIGGLFAGCLLNAAGWSVKVFERA
jgi:phytoene dehydrogenase-like protein